MRTGLNSVIEKLANDGLDVDQISNSLEIPPEIVSIAMSKGGKVTEGRNVNPNVKEQLLRYKERAAERIGELIDSENDFVAIRAAEYIADLDLGLKEVKAPDIKIEQFNLIVSQAQKSYEGLMKLVEQPKVIEV